MPRKNPAAVALGKRGGKVKSDAKAAAARENGKRGGRPQKPIGQLKATVKILIVALVLLSVTACGYHNPTAPTVEPAPVQTTPATIRLTVSSRMDRLVDVTATVLTADGHRVPQTPVTFQITAGTVTPTEATTDARGIAATVASTAPEATTVTVTVGALTATTTIDAVPAPFVLPPPVDPPPAPRPVPTPVPTPGPPTLSATLTSNAGSVAVGNVLVFTVVLGTLIDLETVTAYQWDLDGDGILESTTTIPLRVSAPYTTAGLKTARVQVTTSTGRGATGSVRIVVTN